MLPAKKETRSLLDRRSSNSQVVVASRDDDQSNTDENDNHNYQHRNTISSSQSTRYPLPPPSKPHFIEQHLHNNYTKKIENKARLARIILHLVLGGIILYSLITYLDTSTKRKNMIRERDVISSESSNVERKEARDIIKIESIDTDKGEKLPPVDMHSSSRIDLHSNLIQSPEMDELIAIENKLSYEKVLSTELRDAIAILHTKLFAHDEDYINEFTNDCNFILLSMKTAQKDIEDFEWICSNNSLTKANLERYDATLPEEEDGFRSNDDWCEQVQC